jgi:hypothetical protein
VIGATAHLILFSLLLALQGGHPVASQALKSSIVFIQVPYKPAIHNSRTARTSFLPNQAAETGSRIVRLSPEGLLTVLTPEFASAADPSVSFDGHRILFSGKRASGNRWDIWEMDADGRNKRQITRDLGNCREPEYLALSSITPPDFDSKVRWIAFVSDTPRTYQEVGAELVTSLYVISLESVPERGTVTWRTTFNLSGDSSPTVLRDGRVLFTSGQKSALGIDAHSEFPLLAANWDGTGLNLFCGGGQGKLFKTMACETPDRALVFVESASPAELGGQLARVYFRRPLRSYESLSRGDGWYLNPHAFPDGQLAVSFTSGKESYGLFLFDFSKGAPGPRIFDDPDYEDLDAQLLIERPEPQGLISSVVDSLKWGDLHCINVYESDQPGMAQVKKGDVKRARFVQGLPVPAPASKMTAQSTHAQAGIRVLGEVPVEADGSFFVRVPADTPFQIELLDGRGSTMQKMSRWIWVRPGTSRGCIGCHENKELAPENRVTDALRKASPHDLLGKQQGR